MATACGFVDGFDHYNSTTYLAMKWNKVNGSGFSWVSALHAGSGNALQVNSGSDIAQNLSSAAGAEGRFGFYAQRSADTARDLIYICSDSAAATQICRIRWNSDGTFTLYDSTNTSVASSTSTAVAGSAYHIEVLMTAPSTPNICTLYVNGALYISATTVKTSHSNINSVSIGGTGSSADTGPNFTIDHFYCDLASAATGLTQQGPSEVLYFPPTADGVTNNWSASSGSSKYAMINENPPDTTTYIFPTAANSQMQQFAVTYPSGYTAKDYALTALGHQAGTETLALRHSATDGGTESNFTTTVNSFGLSDTMVQGTETGVSGPTLVSGNAFLGVRRTA